MLHGITGVTGKRLLILAGILLSGFLTAAAYIESLPCDCKIVRSVHAFIGPFPLSVYGIAFFAFLLYTTFRDTAPTRRVADTMLVCASLAGLYFIFLQYLSSWCMFCVMTWVIIALLYIGYLRRERNTVQAALSFVVGASYITFLALLPAFGQQYWAEKLRVFEDPTPVISIQVTGVDPKNDLHVGTIPPALPSGVQSQATLVFWLDCDDCLLPLASALEENASIKPCVFVLPHKNVAITRMVQNTKVAPELFKSFNANPQSGPRVFQIIGGRIIYVQPISMVLTDLRQLVKGGGVNVAAK